MSGFDLPNCLLLRAADQVELVLRGHQMRVEQDANGLVLRPSGDDAKLAVTLGPQHTMEPIPTTSSQGDRAVFAGGTTVVFAVAATTAPIRFTVDGVLAALNSLPLHVQGTGIISPLPVPPAPVLAATALAGSAEVDRAAAGSPTGAWGERVRRAQASDADLDSIDDTNDEVRAPVIDPEPPDAAPHVDGVLPPGTATQLRLPSRLRLSPRGGATAFVHSAAPATKDGRTELWHTRLARRRTDGQPVEVSAKLTVLGTDEQGLTGIPEASDQRLWGGAFTRTAREALVGRSLRADHLMLSGLGAWTDLSYDDSQNGYVHRLVQGRDMALRTKLRGTLYPLGHTAVLTNTIRRVLPPDNGRISTMVTSSVVTVVYPTASYSGSSRVGRTFPWGSVRLLELTTPAGTTQPFRHPTTNVATVGVRLLVDGAVHEWACLGTDRGGRESTFSMPLIFVPETATAAAHAAVQAAYQALPVPQRTLSIAGQTLTVAEPSAQAPEATDVVVDTVLLTTDGDNPTVTQIVGKLPSLQQFAPALGDAARVLTWATAFQDHGFDTGPAKNVGQLVLQLGGQAAPLFDLADPALTGALVSPRFAVNAISRVAGPVGGKLADLAAGSVPAADLIGQALGELTMFGAFRLVDLLGPQLRFDLTGTQPELPSVPRMVTDAIDGVSLPRLHWETPLFTGPAKEVPALPPEIPTGPVTATLAPISGTTARLVLDARAELEQPVVPTAPVVHQHTTCRVENVALTLGLAQEPLVRVGLKHIEFATTDGRKPDVDVDLAPIEFFGVLAFVQSLAALVPHNGFYDPPALDIRPDGITSSFALPLPAVSVGVFSLENITFSAQLDLWYSRPPELSLHFATVDNPFTLSVMALGGRGHLGLTVSTRGLERFDGSLAFGACASVNLGVARGSVSIMGGIHFAYDFDEGTSLSGFLDLRGEIDVLGLIEVGVSLLVMLTYEFDTGDLVGKAEMVVKIKLLFLRKTVRVPFSYTFQGGGDGARTSNVASRRGLPGFLDQMAPPSLPRAEPRPWDDYCTAFAVPTPTPNPSGRGASTS